VKQTIIQHGAMSGDMFQLAVALMLDPELRLILIGCGGGGQDKSESLYRFYVHDSGISADRIHRITVANEREMELRTKAILKSMHEDIFNQETTSVGQATNVVEIAFTTADHSQTIRGTWLRNAGLEPTAFARMIRDWNLPLVNPLVVLWSRQSGALGGLHPEHDTSYRGLEELVERFTREGYSCIIVGDDPGGKIAGPLGSVRYRQACRLGEFWQRAAMWRKPRVYQFAFFEALRQLVPTLTHVGMRSGNLEAYAYMGHRVIFLEEQGRTDSVRMDKLIKPGVQLRYTSVKLEHLPTRTGRFLMEKRLREEVLRATATVRKDLKVVNKDNKAAEKRRAELGEGGMAQLRDFKALEEGALPEFQKDLRRYQMLKGSPPVAKARQSEKRGFGDRDLEQIFNTVSKFPKPSRERIEITEGASPSASSSSSSSSSSRENTPRATISLPSSPRDEAPRVRPNLAIIAPHERTRIGIARLEALYRGARVAVLEPDEGDRIVGYGTVADEDGTHMSIRFDQIIDPTAGVFGLGTVSLGFDKGSRYIRPL
jgi:hypothetical protein